MRLLVIGMHRSGTSAVGRALTALGVPTADPEAQIGPAPSNPLGHYEVEALTALNDRLLGLLGGHWAGPPAPLDDGTAQRLRDGELGDEARGALDELLPDDWWFWKDPRLCLLLPFWRPLVEPTVALLVHRDPAEVAMSLQRRNSIPAAYGAALWERYVREALLGLSGVPTHVVGYDALTVDPAATIARIGRFLVRHGWQDLADVEESAAIDATLRHGSESAGAGLTPQQLALAEQLDALVGSTITRAEPAGEPTPGMDPAFEVMAGVGPGIDRLAGLEQELAAVDEDRRRAVGEIDRLDGELRASRAAAADELDRVHGELADSRRTAQAELDRVTAELDRAHADGQAAVDRVGRELLDARMQASIDEAELIAARDDLAAQVAALHQQVADLGGHAHDLQRQLDELVGSTAFQVVAAGRSAVNRALPAGSRRRQGYSVAVARSREAVRGLRRSGDFPHEPAAPFAPVDLDEPADPLAAIVIPAYGQRPVTARCLESLRDVPAGAPARVVVVDDDSPDDTGEFLSACRGVRVVTNGTNQGFLRSTNRGVAESGDTPYVVLLNNDTEVTPGWLEALLAPFDDPTVGAVGAKLVYPDGTLQEVGSIVWRDGTGWNYGRGDDPHRHPYEHVREVDYCSAACLAVRRDLWEEIGGFDDRFVPAYYEDTDLCFAVREQGFRVMVQPAAVVVHHEGGSHGTDEGTGGKAHQERNRPVFVEKWAARLAEHPDNDPAAVARRSDRATGPSVLVVDHQVPTPDRDSGSLRMSRLLRMLTELGHRVRFLPLNRFRYPPYGPQLEQMGIEVVAGSVEPNEYLAEVGDDLDIVVLSRPVVAVNLLHLVRELAPGAGVVYDMVDFHGLREERRADVEAGDVAAAALGELEQLLVRHSDMTFAISDEERALMAAAVPDATIVTIPNVHDSPASGATFDERSGLLFVGSWAHVPNRDAVRWLVDELMPDLRSRLAGIRLYVVGSDVPADVAAGAGDVEVLGWVPDLDELFDRVRLSVAPLRYGAGLKGKVGDSLVRGVPVVTTSIGAEGFEAAAADGFVVADGAEAFVDAVTGLYTDEARWTAMAVAGRRGVLATLGYDAVRSRLSDALGGLVGDRG